MGRNLRRISLAAALLLTVPLKVCGEKPVFLAGAARRDVTPREPVPMWGYGARRDALSTGTMDPLWADAVVIRAGDGKIALVGLDLGRSPSEQSLERIRRRIREKAGIEHSIIAGSHTHHGPVLELSAEEGKGKGRFDAALRYYREMEDAIVEAVLEADRRLRPAKVAAGALMVEAFNRNRHSRIEPKPVDRDLAVLRLDAADGQPIAVVVNFAAHPTMIPSEVLQFSADYVGALKERVRKETGAVPLFLQGACGDLSASRGARKDHAEFGEALGGEAARLAQSLQPEEVAAPKLEVREERFRFGSRTNFANPLIRTVFAKAFFPELVANYLDEYSDGIRPRLTVALLNREVAFVGASGEFFSSHSIRLKERARLRQIFFCGYANGYHQYFPTIEAAAEGGYGADSTVSPAEVGAGEQMMNRALMWIYQMRGELK